MFIQLVVCMHAEVETYDQQSATQVKRIEGEIT